MFELAHDQSGPRIKQLTVFLANRLGSLLDLTRRLESRKIRVCALSILDAAEHAVVRLLVDRPDQAMETLGDAGIQVFETEVLGVALPAEGGVGIRKILSALLMAEVNVRYVFSIMVTSDQRPVLAISVDDIESAIRVLREKNLDLIGQDELEEAE